MPVSPFKRALAGASVFALLLTCALIPAVVLGVPRATDPDALDDAPSKAARAPGTAIHPAQAGRYRIEITDADGKPIDSRRFVRGTPGQWAVSEFPRDFALEGQPLFTAGGGPDARMPQAGGATVFPDATEDPADDPAGTTAYHSACSASLPPGRYTIEPFGLTFEVAAKITPSHPALVVDGNALHIRTTPVTFRAADAATGVALPLTGLRLQPKAGGGAVDLLDGLAGDGAKGDVAFNPLTLFLPVGCDYASSLGPFRIDERGKVIPGEGAAFEAGAFVRKIDTRRPPKQPTAPGYWLASHGLRRVLRRGESAPFQIIVAGSRPASRVPITVTSAGRSLRVGQLDLPPVADGSTDSRLFFLDTGALAAGRYEIGVDAPDSHPFAFEIVDLPAVTPLFLHTVACCNGADFTLDSGGLDQLKSAGVSCWVTYGHGSSLGGPRADAVPTPAPAGAPDELARPSDGARLLLDDTLRHGLGMIDYENRRLGWYNEGLAFHHSEPTSVDRMVRRVQIFAQEVEEYPAFTGMSYTWFPSLAGYVEGGVATDPFFGTRLGVLRQKVKRDTGFEPLTPAEQAQWQKAMLTPAGVPRALADKQRNYFRAEQREGFGDTFAHYDAKLREVRPDLICTTSENAGHDGGKSLADLGTAHDAMSFESYTDYGDWPMSAGFVTDWAHGNLPGKPVWMSVEGSQTEPAICAKQFYCFARGAEGVGVPLRSPAGARANRKRALTNRFLERYGSLVTAYEPDRTVAVMACEIQDSALYHAHALHSHLTRLGYGPVILSERTVEAGGVPAGVKAIFIPNLRVPFSDACEKNLQAFMRGGGKVVLVGEQCIPLTGAMEVKVPLKHLWDVGGFAAHLAFWQEFKSVRRALERAIATLGLSPRNGAAPAKGPIIPLRSGGVDYVAVVASPADTKDTEFNPVPQIGVKVGSAKKVLNVVTGRDLEVHDGSASVDLIDEPVALLALLPAPPSHVTLSCPPSAVAGQVLTLSARTTLGDVDARLPVELVLSDPAGMTRATFYRLSGEPTQLVSWRVPAGESGGAWSARATELLTGLTARATITIRPAAAVEAVAPAPAVFTPHPDRLDRYLKHAAEVRVIVEETQSACLADAGRVVAALRSAGRAASLQRVDSNSFDTLWLRWLPTPRERDLLERIDRGDVIGFRGDLSPFIQKATRTFIPERGGWADLKPSYVVRNDVIVFDGNDCPGRLGASLRAVSGWVATANTPGKGEAALEVALSPFSAERDALAVVANDAASRTAAVDALVRAIGARATAVAPPPFAPPVTTANIAIASDQERVPLETPLARFVPPALAEGLASSVDGFVAVRSKQSTSLFSPGGKLVRAAPPEEIGPLVGSGGVVFSGNAAVLRNDESWHFPTAWDVSLRRWDAGGGIAAMPAISFDRVGGQWDGWRDGFALSPDAKTLFAGRQGGGFALVDATTGAARWVDEPTDRTGFYEEARDPLIPAAARFSPDGRFVAYGTCNYPSGYGAMGGAPPNPYACSLRVIDVAAGRTVWRADATTLNDSALAPVGGCLAISNEGRRTALIDWDHRAALLDEGGKKLFRKPIFDWKAKFGSGLANRPPLRAELSDDGSTALFASEGNLLLTDDNGGTLAAWAVDALCDARLSADGRAVYAADVDGNVFAFDRAGHLRWSLKTTGERPKLAATRGGVVVAEGAGRLVWVDDADGKVRHEVDFNAPPTEGTPAPKAPQSPAYQESQTLAVLTKFGAKQIARWPAQEAGTVRKFVAVATELKLTAAAGDSKLVHLVYRHRAPAGQGPSVTLSCGGKARTFVLDLPTPAYRVVELPCETPGELTVILTPVEGLEVAELSAWSFQFPGSNAAYIRPASADLERTAGVGDDAPRPAPKSADVDVLDDRDPSQAAKAAAGKMKSAAIFSTNPDPDQIAGRYLRDTGNPLDNFDGRRFADGKGSAWTKAKDGPYGSRLILDLGHAARPKCCATYERTLRQSEVMRGIAILRGTRGDLDAAHGGPELLAQERRAVAVAPDNDQFFNVFDLQGVGMDALAVYVFSGRGKDHGLSEVELYE